MLVELRIGEMMIKLLSVSDYRYNRHRTPGDEIVLKAHFGPPVGPVKPGLAVGSRFGTQNGAQNRVQNRVQNGKIDIQSWVLIRPFSASLDPEMARKWQSIRRKKLFFSHFEARELSYPIMTFPGHFLNLQNLEI